MESWIRTHTISQLLELAPGTEVRLNGWVHRQRDHGGVLFVDLRDRSGIVQVVFRPEVSPELLTKAQRLRNEEVVAIWGRVEQRPPGTENPELPTGTIEVVATNLLVLSPLGEDLPYYLHDKEVDETLRLKYRYLDLRTQRMKERLYFRHRLTQIVRSFLNREGFWEIETPMLTRSTPEGARDFLVPSRIHSGKFYALPQSPQLYKQILMVGGIERYYQIARCFRDEDLRADRQPEFTQVDLEMSFVDEDAVMALVEKLMEYLFAELFQVSLTIPFPRFSFRDAMEQFGTDAPDLRNPLRLKIVTPLFRQTRLLLFAQILENNGEIIALPVPHPNLSRKDLDHLIEWAKDQGFPGLAWVRVEDESWQGPIARHLTSEEQQGLRQWLGVGQGDLIFFGAGPAQMIQPLMGRLRQRLCELLKLREGGFQLLWVVDFPMFVRDPETQRLVAIHHPFTSPREEDLSLLATHPLSVRSRAYDLVLNGIELGGGSIRNHRWERQKKIFEVMGIPPEIYEDRFGFLLRALKHGAPPHGGIALGLDRMTMLFCGASSLREVIAFPKTQRGQDLLLEAPGDVDPEQLQELSIRVSIPQG